MATLSSVAAASALEWIPDFAPAGMAWRVLGSAPDDCEGDSSAFAVTVRSRAELAEWVTRGRRLGLSCSWVLVSDPAASAADAAAVEYLSRAIEHAPQDPGPLAPGLLGWRVGDTVHCCAKCAGRIMSRGCRLPAGSDPVWRDSPAASGLLCCLCCDGFGASWSRRPVQPGQ